MNSEIKNEPNSKKVKMDVNRVLTMDYENISNWAKRTQFKPKQSQFQNIRMLYLAINHRPVSFYKIEGPAKMKSSAYTRTWLMKLLLILLLMPSGCGLKSKYYKALKSINKKGLFSNSRRKKVRNQMAFIGRAGYEKKVLDLELSLIPILTMFIILVLFNFMSWKRLGEERMASQS